MTTTYPWTCEYCKDLHWHGVTCSCPKAEADQNFPPSLDVDDIDLDLPPFKPSALR